MSLAWWTLDHSRAETYEDVILASIDGSVDNRASRDPKMKSSFRRKDRFSREMKVSAYEIELTKLDELKTSMGKHLPDDH
jgi:hypothetical protein